MEEKRQPIKIVVAVDESEESMRALRWACKYVLAVHVDKSNEQSYKLILLHVQPNNCLVAGPVFILSNEVIGPLEYDARRTTQNILKGAVDICETNNVKAETHVVVGDPKERICEAVQMLGAHFLVMGSHGYGGFIRAIRGSVSDYCSRNAVCPVVVVNKKVL
eukprot:Gb_37406 [translate_table: standard]